MRVDGSDAQWLDYTKWGTINTVTKVLDGFWGTIVAQVVLNFWLDMIF